MQWMPRWFLIATTLALFSGSAPAQDTPQEPPPAATPPGGEKAQAGELAPFQTLAAMSDEGRAKLKEWIGKRVDTIISQSAKDAKASSTEAKAAAADLRLEFARPGNSSAFKEAYVQIANEVIAPAYKSAGLPPATQLVSVLGAFNEPVTTRTLIDALSDERPAVRAAAASGLRTLRQKLAAAGGNAANEAIDALRDSGRKESSLVGLEAIYAALNYPEVGAAPDPKRNAMAVLDILEARAEQYAAKHVKGGGADAAGLVVMNSLKAALSDAERERIAVIAGRMLLYSVHRYLAEFIAVTDKTHSSLLVDERNHTEILIDECERTLKDLLKPQGADEPNLGKAMRDPGKNPGDRPINIRNEANKWAKLLAAKTNQKFELEEVAASTP
jgi:hypothetical protein